MPGVITSTTASRQAPPSPANPSQASVTLPPVPETPPPPAAAPSASSAATTIAELQASLRQVSQGLQLSRASTMALMRLLLAVRSGDRQQAMEAMDRLDALDAEMERLVARLPSPGNSDSAGADPTWQTLTKHLDDQKLALAFEKLALASGIVGPDLVSIEHAWPVVEDNDETQQAEPGQHAPPEPMPESPDLSALWAKLEDFEPEEPRGISPRVAGLLVTLLLVAAIAGAVLLLR